MEEKDDPFAWIVFCAAAGVCSGFPTKDTAETAKRALLQLAKSFKKRIKIRVFKRVEQYAWYYDLPKLPEKLKVNH